MQVNYYTAIIAGLLGATLAQTNTTTDFDPFTKPSKGDTIQAGKPYTTEWNLEAANYPGQVQLVLKSGSDPDDLKTLGGIATNIGNSKGKYKWDVSDTLSSGDDYYIQIALLESKSEKSVYSLSPVFSIKGTGNSTSEHQTGIATSSSNMTTTGSSMGTPSTSAPSSTSTGAGSVATANVPAPFALLSVVAVGILAF